jgi:hypothetical protein
MAVREVKAENIDSMGHLVAMVTAITESVAADRSILFSISERLARIESRSVDADIAKLQLKMAEMDHTQQLMLLTEARREGALTLAGWISKNGGWLGMIIIGGVAYLAGFEIHHQ